LEILLLLEATLGFLAWAKSKSVRGLLYIVIGFPTLGVSGDLGIAAGVLLLVIGIVFLVWGIITDRG
jgi:hypothetical protein